MDALSSTRRLRLRAVPGRLTPRHPQPTVSLEDDSVRPAAHRGPGARRSVQAKAAVSGPARCSWFVPAGSPERGRLRRGAETGHRTRDPRRPGNVGAGPEMRLAEAKRVRLTDPAVLPFSTTPCGAAAWLTPSWLWCLPGQASRSDAARIASSMTDFWSASAPCGYARRCSARTTSVAPVSRYSTTSGRLVVETTR
jgi:hypothetical protein